MIVGDQDTRQLLLHAASGFKSQTQGKPLGLGAETAAIRLKRRRLYFFRLYTQVACAQANDFHHG
jgi:hypothetical protein